MGLAAHQNLTMTSQAIIDGNIDTKAKPDIEKVIHLL